MYICGKCIFIICINTIFLISMQKTVRAQIRPVKKKNSHMKTHTKQKVDSPFVLRFFKRAPAKKIAVLLKPMKNNPQQIKLRPKSRPKPLRPSKISRPAAPPIPSEDLPPPPPRRPRSTYSSTSDLSHYVAPESIISSSLDKRSP